MFLFFPHTDFIFTSSFVNQPFHRDLLQESTDLRESENKFKYVSKLKEFYFENVSAFVLSPAVPCGASLFTFFTISQTTCRQKY